MSALIGLKLIEIILFIFLWSCLIIISLIILLMKLMFAICTRKHYYDDIKIINRCNIVVLLLITCFVFMLCLTVLVLSYGWHFILCLHQWYICFCMSYYWKHIVLYLIVLYAYYTYLSHNIVITYVVFGCTYIRRYFLGFVIMMHVCVCYVCFIYLWQYILISWLYSNWYYRIVLYFTFVMHNICFLFVCSFNSALLLL